jgi:hypothetical protein
VPRTLFLVVALLAAAPCRAQTPEDSFAAGYAGALLESAGIAGATVTVAGGEALVRAAGLSAADKESLARSLRRAPGVACVRFPPDETRYPRDERGSGARTLFPRRPVFAPLLADPREPGFSGAMLSYRPGADVSRVWAASFGATLGIVEGALSAQGRWQLGLQGDVFTLWNLDTVSDDHINADFLVGLPLTWRRGRLSAMARLHHVSSHLGDEFVLTHPRVSRMNLAYEALDLKVSYDLSDRWRVYGGGGRMIRRDPRGVGPGSLQAGAEYTHDRAYLRGLLRPVAAVDLQKHEKSGWETTDVSARAGLQVEHRFQASRRALLLGEFYKGKDPNGQFFRRSIHYLGLGLHVYF